MRCATEMDNQQPSLFEGKKVCTRCGEEKDIAAFKLYKNRRHIYRRSWCVPCDKQYMAERFQSQKEETNRKAREYRQRNLEKVRASSRKWAKVVRDRHQATVYAAYGNRCKCCGEADTRFLSIDHVNNDGHVERKAKTQGNLYSRIIRAGFPDSYQLLCFNCNLGKARNKGVCPHQEGSTIIAQASTAKRPEVPSPL